MKKLSFLLLLLFIMQILNANEPEEQQAEQTTYQPKKQTVYSIVKQQQSNSWYEAQAELWEADINKNSKDAVAWMNFYSAKRMLKLMRGGVTQDDLNKIIDRMEEHIPETFEFNYVKYWNSNNNVEDFHYLEKAYEIDPSRPETFDDFITYYELRRDKHQVKKIAEDWFNSNDMSAGLYAWGYNQLMSVSDNAILLTQGDNDTYPAWVMQQVKGVKKDVMVLNISLLMDTDYRNKILEELNIPSVDKELKELKSYREYRMKICKHLFKHTNRDMYLSSTIDRTLYEELKDNLYLVGLAYKWTEDKFDNIGTLRKNYEKNFLKDNLKISLNNDISAGVINHMNGSYLVPLITLHNHYKETEEVDKQNEVELIANNIAKEIGNLEDVQEMLQPEKFDNVVSYVIKDPRDALFGFLEINDTMHVSQCEIRNGMYNKFLLDLLKQKRYDDLETAKSEKVDWNSLLLPMYKGIEHERIFAHGKEDNEAFPVLNISYEAAVLYCEWLTNIYNSLEHKKKKYKKVLFRLPTEKEWEYLARSGNDDYYVYPWGSPNPTNIRGCYLGNFQTLGEIKPKDPKDPKSCPAHDGGVFPVYVHSYNPNDFGLFNMVGNVSEMIKKKGIAKGGSWDTPPAEATIDKQQTYEGPDPRVGFRPVMIVIEK